MLFGVLSRHHEYARFSTQRGIDFMIAHLKYVAIVIHIILFHVVYECMYVHRCMDTSHFMWYLSYELQKYIHMYNG